MISVILKEPKLERTLIIH